VNGAIPDFFLPFTPSREPLETVTNSHERSPAGDGPHPTALALRPKADTTQQQDHIYALIDYQDTYVQPLILAALASLFPPESYTLLPPPSTPNTTLSTLLPSPTSKILQITQYESLDFDHAAAHPRTTLLNSYMIRKALIRKHYLSSVVDVWAAKNPGSVLRTNVRRAEAFEVDYAEFLDDALVEAFDLRASMERNEDRPEQEREWWILKPGMSDRGQGIRLFSSMGELQGIFDGWEAERGDSDEEEEVEDDDADAGEGKDYITTSHLRHFVAQPYIHPPLLLPQLSDRKFHIRVYVCAVGSLKVYVYRHMLALFAGKPYTPPWEGEGIDLDAHLTNTCLQGPDSRPDSVVRFADLPLPPSLASASSRGSPHEEIFAQIGAVTGEVFEAAARTTSVHFQPQGSAFEVFGVDFLVDDRGTAWLLEVNAFPDFRQTGEDGHLREVVAGFWRAVMGVAVAQTGFARAREGRGEENGDMVLVREVDLGRR
jgi:hypothetical protein